MTVTPISDRPPRAVHPRRPHAPGRTALVRRFLDWLAERDRRHREATHLATLPEERLRDAGLARPSGRGSAASRPLRAPGW